MELYFKSETIKALRKAGVKSPVFGEDGTDWRDREIESKHIQPDDFHLIRQIVKKTEFWSHIENRRVFKKLDAVESLKTIKQGSKVKNLEVLAEAIREFFLTTAHKWVFVADAAYGSLVPYFVTSVKFHPPERRGNNYVPPYVSVHLNAIARGQEVDKTFNFHKEDLPATVESLLGEEEAYIETPNLVSDYEAEVQKYQKGSPRTGEQYLAHGRGQVVEDENRSNRWHRGEISLEKEGEPSKVVMDDGLGQGKNPGLISMKFWSSKHVREDDDEEDDGEKMIPLPVHPIVRVFNLETHDYLDCHIANLDEYRYDASIINKLVLPDTHKELIDLLTGGAIKRMDDIVRGKAVGIIILCSGKPGTGKTLTSEVYSEAAQRPLYMVQCSQLGTDDKELETHLSEVLARATRWKAILLIDEADVYIHERGADIHQNAIVGVFLRLLEYYKGILFLTTNRETVVDDAIVSRVTAHVRYTLPADDESRRKLWTVLCKQYGVDPTTAFLNEALRDFPNVSGRDIRQLIRLARIMADHEKKPTSMAMIRRVSKFHDFTEPEERK